MKKIFLTLLTVSLLGGASTAVAQDFTIAAKHAIAVEANTGKILYEKDATQPVEIASITKLITVYLVYEALENGSITLSTPVDISDYPYQLTTNSEASNIPMEARNYTVEELLEATLVSSANSAAIALAEKIAGSEKDFVDMMRAKLLEWGIQDATVVNTTGLNNETLGDNIYPGSKKDEENKLSAYDVAIVARNLIKKYPQVLEITKKPSSTFAGMTITSTNYMLEGMPAYRGGFDGLKTGTTDKAGESFVGTTVEKGMRVITVVLNADHQDNNPYARFTATSSLMDYISSTFTLRKIVQQGDAYQDSKAPVQDGKEDTVTAVTAVAPEDIYLIERVGNQSSQSVQFTPDSKAIPAPLEAGTVVGHLTYEDKDLIGQGYITTERPSFEMVADKKIEKAFFLKVWWNQFVRFVNEKL
ncbi:TPA: D-alanyl-D-alanine carboxypeptidase PBP3 [Streptococcus pneumoniae]|uniref:D-alanyl-D-alanine carboxypeptidase PBP3 n=1 Tax=Streptococcus pneumoniae TaxID=1313 RepID=UPI0005E47B65|nr:D-alanyl-D-alanine carboxypeptidase PBP3 [Streptococcus pneumoniae]CJE93917.1 D-alanyl-D-alanine carboxypeptidase%2C penicillin-binding protein 3 [Streptococcus pneumoniae]CVM89222.1 D-alanyl-D-alanine carboxypeptidase%2C penicillin-binding protein 3 [Streptococcus pneumoniae]CVR66357.1 D-alanyl-D-alanine carboxypeptidase%2C penicillin-binding protein 3 [Streptococcus pneumoniae]HEU5594401.1 D-alanyl-D-alanine carboxypeptidase [Streptococcus pneumoniae]HEV9576512.1 D-alanyl-D-alanine carbox